MAMDYLYSSEKNSIAEEKNIKRITYVETLSFGP